MVDAGASKASGVEAPCGFESHLSDKNGQVTQFGLEYHSDTVGVAGSSPALPTIFVNNSTVERRVIRRQISVQLRFYEQNIGPCWNWQTGVSKKHVPERA